MPRKKCPKTDAHSSPSAKSKEYCLTEEEIKNIIPAFIWEQQQETLRRAGLSPPNHIQLGVNPTTTTSANELNAYSDCDDLLKYLENADLLLDEEQSKNFYQDYQEGQPATSMQGICDEDCGGTYFNTGMVEDHQLTETHSNVIQSPPCMSRLRLSTECDEDESQNVSITKKPQNEEKTTQGVSDSKSDEEAPSSSRPSLPKRFFTQEDQIPIDEFCSDSSDEEDDDDE